MPHAQARARPKLLLYYIDGLVLRMRICVFVSMIDQMDMKEGTILPHTFEQAALAINQSTVGANCSAVRSSAAV